MSKTKIYYPTVDDLLKSRKVIDSYVEKAIKFIHENPDKEAYVTENYVWTDFNGGDNSIELSMEWDKMYYIANSRFLHQIFWDITKEMNK